MEERLRNVETLQEDGELFAFRTFRDGEPLIVVRPAGEVTPDKLAKLERAFALRGDLDPAWAARPRALEKRQGPPVLLLDDPGGTLLARRVGRAWELTELLRVGIGAAAALRELHARGIVHRDIKPSHLLYAADGSVRLLGFGIATSMPRQDGLVQPPGIAIGTLAYMAPEQTGRLARPIDGRADLYALGITLYQLATGALPFAAGDPSEWIHAHLARRPQPIATVPATVAAVILKLLAKNPEDRYQTAAGLEADLRRCRFEWEAHGAIERFVLGEHDGADHLRVRDRLYGRNEPLEVLRAALDRLIARGGTEVVLISGSSGIGKTALAGEVAALAASRALYAAGKPDQVRRGVPYATIAQALQSLTRQILAKSDTVVARWRAALHEALDPNGQIAVDLVPELEIVLGKQPPVAELPPREAKARFSDVFGRLLAAFARPEHPLVLFLDDLQWTDPETIELVCASLRSPQRSSLLLVGAHRDVAVGAGDAIRATGAPVHTIELGPLAAGDIAELVADTLCCDRAVAGPLAEVVHAKTGGNPLYAIQFLRSLVEDDVLAFDPARGAWQWELDRVRTRGATDNVIDLLAHRLDRFAPATRRALGLLACLGHDAPAATLAAVCEVDEAGLEAMLAEAIDAVLVTRAADGFAFVHDRVQEAAYALVAAGERAATHLRIGGILLRRLPSGELDARTFDVADQLTLGLPLIVDPDERLRVAELLLGAGRRARAAVAYTSALKYLEAARRLVGEDGLDRHYALAFAIELAMGECEAMVSPPAAAERLAALAPRAIGLVDQAAVTCLRVTLSATLDTLERSTTIGLDYLRLAGIDWGCRPSPALVDAEYQRLWALLGDRPIESLVDLPLLSDPTRIAVMDVLQSLLVHTVFFSPALHQLVVLRMMNFSLEHGNSDASCLAYAEAPLVLGPAFDNHRAGYRFCRLGYELVERGKLVRYKPRVYLLFAWYVVPWDDDVRASRALLERAHAVSRQLGDFTFIAGSRQRLVSSSLARGDPLAAVEAEADAGCAFCRDARFASWSTALPA